MTIQFDVEIKNDENNGNAPLIHFQPKNFPWMGYTFKMGKPTLKAFLDAAKSGKFDYLVREDKK